MIELLDKQLTFRFPDVHERAECRIAFQRTLRIPDDNREYPLPPGLGRFPVEHVDDFADRLPAAWLEHGGVLVPMYQSEALWINFSGSYPCAVKIAAGKIDAVSGEAWSNSLSADPQDYVVLPKQPWLDGFNVSEDYIRQFVAMPLGEGYTAEEQIAGAAEHGGLQIVAYPMKRDVYVEYMNQFEQVDIRESMGESCDFDDLDADLEMGLAPGGLMRQKIFEDEHGIDAWDQDKGFRCFVHLANSELYRAVTGHAPPHKPATASDYTSVRLPWFDYYADGKSLPGSDTLSKLTSVAAKAIEKGLKPLPDNTPVEPKIIRALGTRGVVRDGNF